MSNKNIWIPILILILIGAGLWWYGIRGSEGERVMNDEGTEGMVIDDTGGKIKADVFTGKLEELNTGCFVDAECYAVVDGKHVTLLRGWSRDTVGAVLGVEGIGDLESHIGEEVEVYAHDMGDGTYSLYGSAGFYLKLKSAGIE